METGKTTSNEPPVCADRTGAQKISEDKIIGAKGEEKGTQEVGGRHYLHFAWQGGKHVFGGLEKKSNEL